MPPKPWRNVEVALPRRPPRREKLRALGEAVPRGLVHATARSTTGRSWRDDVWSAATASDVTSAAALCPAPAGFESAETFRVWEALEAGCVPLLEAAQEAYFTKYAKRLEVALNVDARALFPLFVRDWADAAIPNDADARQAAALRAWARLKDALAADFEEGLRGLASSKPFAVFVAIPKTGTRTVLETLRSAGVGLVEGRDEATRCLEHRGPRGNLRDPRGRCDAATIRGGAAALPQSGGGIATRRRPGGGSATLAPSPRREPSAGTRGGRTSRRRWWSPARRGGCRCLRFGSWSGSFFSCRSFLSSSWCFLSCNRISSSFYCRS